MHHYDGGWFLVETGDGGLEDYKLGGPLCVFTFERGNADHRSLGPFSI